MHSSEAQKNGRGASTLSVLISYLISLLPEVVSRALYISRFTPRSTFNPGGVSDKPWKPSFLSKSRRRIGYEFYSKATAEGRLNSRHHLRDAT